MRLRNIPYAKEAIINSEFASDTPIELQSKWQETVAKGKPIYIEIGMGKGQFIHTLAKQNPDIQYIGIEKYASVLVRAIQKIELEPLPNLHFILMDAERIVDVFGMGEVDKIYLNFSDPWPKERHAKRRLPSRQFLQKYETILNKDGTVEFKTDNKGLFEFALEEIQMAGWNLDQVTHDLHNDGMMNVGNIMTEYEQKFSEQGNPIYKYVISKNGG